MAKSEPDADREQAAERAGEHKPVVKSLSIGIKQDQKFDLRRTLISTASELWMQMSVRRWRKRRRPARDPIEAAARELWPHTQGKPPETVSTPVALRLLGNELDRRGIPAGPDTLDSQRRAIDRR
jgi:hypothetical protein